MEMMNESQFYADCNDCGARFVAERFNQPCPECGSENTEPADDLGGMDGYPE